MKKLMILVAIAAMAFGAQAYTYSLTMKLNNRPTEGAHQGIYLMDSEKNVYAYLTVAELVAYKGKTTADIGENLARTDGSAGPGFIPAEGNILAHKITSINSDSGVSASGTKYTFILSFESNVNIGERLGTWKDESTVPPSFRINGLTAYAPHSLGEDYLALDNKIGISTSGESDNMVYGLTASYTYASVPEPTSAMLLLLGFAGLVLKRKQVA